MRGTRRQSQPSAVPPTAAALSSLPPFTRCGRAGRQLFSRDLRKQSPSELQSSNAGHRLGLLPLPSPSRPLAVPQPGLGRRPFARARSAFARRGGNAAPCAPVPDPGERRARLPVIWTLSDETAPYEGRQRNWHAQRTRRGAVRAATKARGGACTGRVSGEPEWAHPRVLRSGGAN